MDFYKLVKEAAAKTYTEESQLNAFMQGFEKEAGLMGFMAGDKGKLLEVNLMEHPAFTEAAIKSAFGLGAGLLGAGIYQGFHQSSKAIQNNALRSKFESSLQYVKNTNKAVQNANPSKVDSYANTMFAFGPHVVSDPNILGFLLVHVLLGEGIDPTTIKSVTDLEGRYKDNIAPDPLVGIRA